MDWIGLREHTKIPQFHVRGRWYSVTMNTFDEFPPRIYVCDECGYDTISLFYFAGDNSGRCDYCHNNKRVVGVSTSEGDWF